MAHYAIVATVDTPGQDQDGSPVTLPAGTVLNVAEWDGVTPWSPGPGAEAVQDDAQAGIIGGSYANGVFTAPGG